jgi:hypothetical protein
MSRTQRRGCRRLVVAAVTACVVGMVSPALASATGPLSYYGGPVTPSLPTVYSVMWNSHVNEAIAVSDPTFLADFTDLSGPASVLAQYRDAAGPIVRSGGGFGGQYTLVPSRCATSTSCLLSDAELQTELQAQMTAGNLPTPPATA